MSQSAGQNDEFCPKLLIAAVAEPFLKRRSEAILVETKAVELCSISLVYTNCTGGMLIKKIKNCAVAAISNARPIP